MKPTEFFLAHMMCLDSYDQGRLSGRVDLKRWATAMGMVENNGTRIREDRAAMVLQVLIDRRIADVNGGQGTFELRPNKADWWKPGPARLAPPQDELKLSAERPLSEALSEVSREQALRNGPGPDQPGAIPPSPFQELRAALAQGPEAVEQLARKFGGKIPPKEVGENLPKVGGKIPPTSESPHTAGFAQWGENSPQPAIAKLSSDQKKLSSAIAKPAEPSGGKIPPKPAPEKIAEAMRWLESVDRTARLQGQAVYAQWSELCEREPDYVLRRLRGHFEEFEKHYGTPSDPKPVGDPLSWMSRKARDERKLRPLEQFLKNRE